MNYIQLTIGLPLIISINKSGNINWYIDKDFEVHKDMRIHTGGFMTMGTGGSYVQSIKYKQNTNNSTDDKLVGVDVVLTQIIWT